MLPRRAEQRIVVSGVVWAGERVLLWRATHTPDRAARERSGYFDIPRLTVPFGEDPTASLQAVLSQKLGQAVSAPRVLDVTHRMVEEGYTQELEVVYRAEVAEPVDQTGRLVFVPPREVAHYMFAEEYERLRRYIADE